MEKPITNEILKYLNNYPNCFAWKRLNTGMTGTTGFPDINGVVRLAKLPIGVHIEIEVKDVGEEPTDLQYSRLRQFYWLGCIAFWADSIESAETQFLSWLAYFEGGSIKPSVNSLKSSNSFVLGDIEKTF